MSSVLKGFDYKIESFLNKITTEYNSIGLDHGNLIKLVFVLQDECHKEMTNVGEKDADFIISNEKKIEDAIICLKKILENAKLLNYYETRNKSFIPLFIILYYIFKKNIQSTYFDNYDTNNKVFAEMKKWLYLSLINGVFKSRGAGWIPYKTGLKLLHAEIKKNIHNNFSADTLFNVYKKKGLRFNESFNLDADNLDDNFLFYIIYDCEKPNRLNDKDHIMPRSKLSDFEPYQIDNIRNKQLIDSGTNRGQKSGNHFKEWINNWVTDKQQYIERHLIPNDENLFDETRFLEFMEERGKLILEKVKKSYINT